MESRLKQLEIEEAERRNTRHRLNQELERLNKSAHERTYEVGNSADPTA